MTAARDEARTLAEKVTRWTPEFFEKVVEKGASEEQAEQSRWIDARQVVDALVALVEKYQAALQLANKNTERRGARVERLEAALRALHEEVEMAESVGICLPNRVASLNAGRLLSGLGDAEPDDATPNTRFGI